VELSHAFSPKFEGTLGVLAPIFDFFESRVRVAAFIFDSFTDHLGAMPPHIQFF